MGMFDYLRCEMPLPVEWPTEGFGFQTKDTDAQYMERYTITSDGRLVHHAVQYESTPKDELPYPDAKPGTWQSICGIIKSVPTGDVEVPMHGDLGFHDYDRSRGWVSFIARFTEGRCVRIWMEGWRASRENPSAKAPEPAAQDPALSREGDGR